MPVIVGLVSQKGGVGKSTLSRAIAVEAARNKLKVHIADLDGQQSTVAEWAKMRIEARLKPAITAASYLNLATAIANAPPCDLLVLDGPARTSAGTLEIAKVASLVIQPTGASRDDLNPAIRAFHELVAKRIPKAKLSMALCRILGNSEAAEARRYIEEAGYYVADGFLPERISYRTAQNTGRAITETDYDNLNEQAANLIDALVTKIEQQAAA